VFNRSLDLNDSLISWSASSAWEPKRQGTRWRFAGQSQQIQKAKSQNLLLCSLSLLSTLVRTAYLAKNDWLELFQVLEPRLLSEPDRLLILLRRKGSVYLWEPVGKVAGPVLIHHVNPDVFP